MDALGVRNLARRLTVNSLHRELDGIASCSSVPETASADNELSAYSGLHRPWQRQIQSPLRVGCRGWPLGGRRASRVLCRSAATGSDSDFWSFKVFRTLFVVVPRACIPADLCSVAA